MNPYNIPKAEEHHDGWEDHAERGDFRLKFQWRISMKDQVVSLWISYHQPRGFFGSREVDDNDPSWVRIASWHPKMPFVEACVMGIVGLWFGGWAAEGEPVPQTEFEPLCLEIVEQEAHDDDLRWQRIREQDLQLALAA